MSIPRTAKAAFEQKLEKSALESMEESEVHRMPVREETLLPAFAVPAFAYIHKELLKSGVTLKLLWQEYVDSYHNARWKAAIWLYAENQPGKRIFMPEEVAEVVGFLLCAASACISGEIITCDQGRSFPRLVL